MPTGRKCRRCETEEAGRSRETAKGDSFKLFHVKHFDGFRIRAFLCLALADPEAVHTNSLAEAQSRTRRAMAAIEAEDTPGSCALQPGPAT